MSRDVITAPRVRSRRWLQVGRFWIRAGDVCGATTLININVGRYRRLVTDDLRWFTLLPEPVKIALLADPDASLPPYLVARLPRLFRAFYGTVDPVAGGWALRPDVSRALRNVTAARGREPSAPWTPAPAAIRSRLPSVSPVVN